MPKEPIKLTKLEVDPENWKITSEITIDLSQVDVAEGAYGSVGETNEKANPSPDSPSIRNLDTN